MRWAQLKQQGLEAYASEVRSPVMEGTDLVDGDVGEVLRCPDCGTRLEGGEALAHAVEHDRQHHGGKRHGRDEPE
jgi:hypothetical protein